MNLKIRMAMQLFKICHKKTGPKNDPVSIFFIQYLPYFCPLRLFKVHWLSRLNIERSIKFRDIF